MLIQPFVLQHRIVQRTPTHNVLHRSCQNTYAILALTMVFDEQRFIGNDGRGHVACWANAQKSLNVQTRRRNSWLRSLSQQRVPTHGIVLRFGLGAGHRPALAFCRTPWEIARHYDSRTLGGRSRARSLRPRNSPAAACWCVIVGLLALFRCPHCISISMLSKCFGPCERAQY